MESITVYKVQIGSDDPLYFTDKIQALNVSHQDVRAILELGVKSVSLTVTALTLSVDQFEAVALSGGHDDEIRPAL